MDYITYLFPTELFGKIIIIIQSGLFVLWFVFVIFRAINLIRTKREITNCKDITSLVKTLERAGNPAVNMAKANFDDFRKVALLPDKSLIVSHLETLYRAAFNRSNLDVQSLIKNTEARITKSNQSYRSVISLFIVLGLLGTLMGLATSLSKLSINPSGPNNSVLSESYRLMLEQLSGAFTPSILGVLLTILGVGVFAVLQRYIYGVCLLLEKETVSNWAINLFPSTPQQLTKQLERSEQQLQDNLKAAQDVAAFAQEIRDDAEGLKKDINETRVKFKDLRDASENLVKFSENFNKSINNLPAFQNELRELNKQTLKNSELLQITVGHSLQVMHNGLNTVMQNIDEKLTNFLVPLQTNFNKSLEDSEVFLESNKEFLETVRAHFAEQNESFNTQYNEQKEQLTTLLGSLNLYEEAYVSSRRSIDETLVETLAAVKEANQKLGNQNEAVIRGLAETIGTPLKEEMTNALGTISTELGRVSTTLTQTTTPLDLAAERMSAITEMFDTNMGALLDQIRTEFSDQNQQNHDYLAQIQLLNSALGTLSQDLGSLRESLNNMEKPVKDWAKIINNVPPNPRPSNPTQKGQPRPKEDRPPGNIIQRLFWS
ncbi:MAG: MotA/TolQ/ExbB proton channel family protein [Acidobacteria bacterium]|nr:MotA/TolQ/ExbB proton channel family protein [Acidobacteriota bacterium]